MLGHDQVAGRDERAVVQLAQQLLKDLPRLFLGLGIAKDLDSLALRVSAVLDDRLIHAAFLVVVDASGGHRESPMLRVRCAAAYARERFE